MITGGHIAISYLLAEGSKAIGFPLSNIEILGILIVGNISDVDFLIGLINGKKGEEHHQNITHTPVGIILIWLIVLVILRPDLSFSFILLLSLIIHLILDDLGHIFARIGIYKQVPSPQINWLYPLTGYSKHSLIKNNREVLKHYLIKGWPIAALEILSIIAALMVYFVKAS